MALVKKSRAEVFEKRKSIVMAIFKQDAAERSRRIVAMKDKSCNLSVACVSLLSRWHALGAPRPRMNRGSGLRVSKRRIGTPFAAGSY